MENGATPERIHPKVGIYEHYKSTPEDERHYQVLGFADHTETGEILVLYIPLYTASEHAGLIQQARPLDMFVEDVEHNGKVMPRFRYIGPGL